MLRHRQNSYGALWRKRAAPSWNGALKGKGMAQMARHSLTPQGAPWRNGAAGRRFSPVRNLTPPPRQMQKMGGLSAPDCLPHPARCALASRRDESAGGDGTSSAGRLTTTAQQCRLTREGVLRDEHLHRTMTSAPNGPAMRRAGASDQELGAAHWRRRQGVFRHHHPAPEEDAARDRVPRSGAHCGPRIAVRRTMRPTRAIHSPRAGLIRGNGIAAARSLARRHRSAR